MHYFFDESGNWASPASEQNRLVLAGIALKNDHIQTLLNQEMQIFKADNNIEMIHGSEMTRLQLDKIYGLIDKYLDKDSTAVLLRCFHPSIFRRRTHLKADDIYINLASKLVDDLAFGDDDIHIEYDMKFNYTYPKNIIYKLTKRKSFHIHKMMQDYVLTEEGYARSKQRILNSLSNIVDERNEDQLTSFWQSISNTSENEKESSRGKISEYLWTEFMLRIESNELMRAKFKDQIQFNIKQKMLQFCMEYSEPKLSLEFTNKFNQSAGVQIIDILGNLVYKYGPHLSINNKNISSAVRGIYEKIKIEEVR